MNFRFKIKRVEPMPSVKNRLLITGVVENGYVLMGEHLHVESDLALKMVMKLEGLGRCPLNDDNIVLCVSPLSGIIDDTLLRPGTIVQSVV